MADINKILITGASGLIGGVLRYGLEDQFEIRGIDARASQEFDVHVADMRDLDAIQPAFEGIDAVVDLASNPNNRIPWEVAYDNNLLCTINAFEAARIAGVKRIVFASSNHATGMYENDEPYSDIVAGRYDKVDPSRIPMITVDMPIRPDGPYGIAKAFGEATGRHYSDEYGLSALCLRIGTLNRESRPNDIRQYATLLTHDDLVRLVRACVEAPDDVRFGIYYGVSDNKWRFWDIANSGEEIGYAPQDNAEDWR